MKNIENVLNLLKELPVPYRSAPFWAWNDALEPEELAVQINDMKEQGIGGFFIHSREGLETEYLSEEWMNCVSVSIDSARKNGMEAWIYDEDKWPSGSAGGLVSAADPDKYSAKGLTAELINLNSQDNENILSELRSDLSIQGIYELRFSDEKRSGLSSFNQLERMNLKLSDLNFQDLLVCRMESSGNSEWYNGSAPTDNLNPKAIQCFLELTHEKYKEKFALDFGNTVKGFFTDEPNFCDFFSRFTQGRPWLPWTISFSEYFLNKRSYSLLEFLPLLFFHGSGEEKTRYDYWLTLTELFSSSYTQQLYEWCEDNELQLTGHVLYENDMGYSVRVSGASMPHYKYMHAPGIDILGDQRQEYLTVKQCTSVANQFGRDTVLSETYGCTGWEFSFAGQKRVGDWQFVMGVNKRCQHLSLYSLSGCRKRDYPPSFNYHTTWWSYNHILEDYFSRLSVCVSAGRVFRDILLIHPIGSLWMKSGSTFDEDLGHCEMNMGWLDNHILDLNKEGDHYNQLARRLLMSQFDFDYGDELIIKEDAFVEKAAFLVGNSRYNTVIVPRLETIMSSTLTLLENFLDVGGQVLWVKPYPLLVDAVSSDKLKKLIEKPGLVLVDDESELLSLLAKRLSRPLRICDEFGVELDGFLSMVREVEDGLIITVVNTMSAEDRNVVLSFSDWGQLIDYDLMTGQKFDLKVFPSNYNGNRKMSLQINFNPEQTRVFILHKKKEPELISFKPRYKHPHSEEKLVISFPPRTSISLSMENALPLDVCQFYTGRTLEDRVYLSRAYDLVWKNQRELRSRLGMRPIYYNGAPQRYSWIGKNSSDKTVPMGMEFPFNVDFIPRGPIYAVIEKSKKFRVFCNEKLCTLMDETYIDRSMNKHRIPSLKKGKNILRIELNYSDEVELENVFIAGSFGVSQDRTIISKPNSLSWGDWTLQGLFHYPGSVQYNYTLPALDDTWKKRDLFLKLGKFLGSLAVVRINDSDPLYAFHDNLDFPISELLKTNGENQIDIEIVGNLRNFFGPFHSSYSACSRISWEDFRTEGNRFTSEYNVMQMGLFGELAIISK